MTQSRQHHSEPLKGILAMIASALLLTLNDATTKWLTQSNEVLVVLALRQLFSLLLIAIYIHFITGWGTLKVVNRQGMVWRSVFFVATTATIVLSFSLLPLVLVTAIAFASPLFVVAFSHLFTNEAVGQRRWLATIAGFAGMLMIVQPWASGFELLIILPVLVAIFAGVRDVITRGLSQTESSISILLWSNLAVVTFAFAATTIQGWHAITGMSALIMMLNGTLNAGAHFLMIESLRLGEASLVSPFRYSGLIWATILGLVFWGEYPDRWTLAGAALLVASGIYIIERSPGSWKPGGRL